MKNTLIKILKIAIPLGIGVYLSWFFLSNIEDKQKLWNQLKNANYMWVILSIFIAWISHYSRSIRWKYMLEPLGYKPQIKNLYHTVMIGYVMNLTVPRSGEFARGGFLSKKENLPFDKVFGTIVAERVIDVIMLLGIFFFTSLYVGPNVVADIATKKVEKNIVLTEPVNIEFEQIDKGNRVEWIAKQDIDDEFKAGSAIRLVNKESVDPAPFFNKVNGSSFSIYGVPFSEKSYLLYYIIGGLALAGFLVFFLMKKIRSFVIEKFKGLWSGIKTVFTLKKRGLYIAHTLFIWICYLLMFWVCAQGVGGVADMSLGAVLLSFCVGALAMAATPGGIGLYPLFVTNALIYFGHDASSSEGFGVLMWVSQTVFLIVFGLYSLYAIKIKFTASEVQKEEKV